MAKCILAIRRLGYAAVCVSVVCVSVPRRFPTLLHDPDVTWGNGRGCTGFAAMTTHVCKLIAFLYTANAYGAEREMSASACTGSMAG